MKHQLAPESIIDNDEFELLAEIRHTEIKTFILQQVVHERKVIRLYAAYQISMLALFLFLLIKAIIHTTHGFNQPVYLIAGSALFSVTILVVIHEFIHALAYWATGIRNLSVGAFWRKFIFYVAADRQVVDYPAFRIVALAPFIFVKFICLVLTILFWSSPLAYFFISLMCIHSLFCAGDIAMLAFYSLHSDKEIFNFDDLQEGKTYFYFRKNHPTTKSD